MGFFRTITVKNRLSRSLGLILTEMFSNFDKTTKSSMGKQSDIIKQPKITAYG
jgi:hypothetical protein